VSGGLAFSEGVGAKLEALIVSQIRPTPLARLRLSKGVSTYTGFVQRGHAANIKFGSRNWVGAGCLIVRLLRGGRVFALVGGGKAAGSWPKLPCSPVAAGVVCGFGLLLLSVFGRQTEAGPIAPCTAYELSCA